MYFDKNGINQMKANSLWKTLLARSLFFIHTQAKKEQATKSTKDTKGRSKKERATKSTKGTKLGKRKNEP